MRFETEEEAGGGRYLTASVSHAEQADSDEPEHPGVGATATEPPNLKSPPHDLEPLSLTTTNTLTLLTAWPIPKLIAGYPSGSW